MLEIKGENATAICYANIIEEDAIEQIKTMCDQEFAKDSKIRIMPDVHAGKGCTTGTTMTLTDKVVPNVVGVDIGCGMYTVNIGKVDIDFETFDRVAHEIPSGKNVWQGRIERFDLTRLRCFRSLKDTKRLERSLGTLGGGNHFIEIEIDQNDNKYIVIHSGSRNLGHQVATYYQQLAIDLHKGMEEYFKKRDRIIKEYKETGRRSEIQTALKELKAETKELTMPEALCYLYGTYMEDYLYDVELCQQYATRNRELIAAILLSKCNYTSIDSFHTIHNYIDTNEMILRKGAIAAYHEQRLLIPINMHDGSILATGKGNHDWNFSAPHGAGRVLSRKAAKEKLDMEEYREVMKDIYTTSVNEATLDEAPMAYKSLEDIIDVIKETVDVVEVLKPIYNFKAN